MYFLSLPLLLCAREDWTQKNHINCLPCPWASSWVWSVRGTGKWLKDRRKWPKYLFPYNLHSVLPKATVLHGGEKLLMPYSLLSHSDLGMGRLPPLILGLGFLSSVYTFRNRPLLNFLQLFFSLDTPFISCWNPEQIRLCWKIAKIMTKKSK